MKQNNKLLIFLISLIFILSINFAFAVDDNTTDLTMNVDENIHDNELTVNDEVILSADDSQQNYQQTNDEQYNAVKDDSKLSVEKIQTVKMQGVTNRLNGGIWYKATFYDSTGSPLQNTLVAFSLNDNYGYGYEVVTDSDGVALLKVKLNPGNYKLNGMNYQTGERVSDNIKVFNVITGAKDIKMCYDDGTNYKVRVFDDNGNPVKAGEKVTFYINNKKIIQKTDKNGYASLKITSTPGVYTISAIYKDFAVSRNLVVKNPLKVKMGKTNKNFKTKFTVKFLGKNKKNKLVKIKFNKKTYKAKTNNKGVAVFKVKTPKKLGKYKLVASYKKSKVEYVYTQYRTS